MDESMRRRETASKFVGIGMRGVTGGSDARPYRIAMWGVTLALFAMIAAAAGAQGASETGGVGQDADPVAKKPKGCSNDEFGKRSLRRGDCGTDVKTLNWILRSRRFGDGVKATKKFGGRTDGGVRALQRRKNLKVSGVADRRTRNKLVNTMRRDVATWYGPGLWGGPLACGGRLESGTVGVAHRSLKCGTRVVIRHGGQYLRTRVIDRGPFVRGVTWDLTQKAAKRVGMTATGKIQVAISK